MQTCIKIYYLSLSEEFSPKNLMATNLVPKDRSELYSGIPSACAMYTWKY